MAKRVVTVDDLDGKSEAAENFVFWFDGEWYEIDLSEVNATKFRSSIEPYKNAARPSSAPRKRNGDETQAVRDWAARAGIPVNDKGPIPGPIRQQYDQAMAKAAANGGTATK
ncbi:Lsr2 family protein [Streptomyces sp. NPDC088196]|uniref:histone-like nucleoid-structuring protein Lsr2 n=1 Tax=Streptomyces sp. NPDC088196 TaxID=3154868 RepID=UPI00344C2B84